MRVFHLPLDKDGNQSFFEFYADSGVDVIIRLRPGHHHAHDMDVFRAMMDAAQTVVSIVVPKEHGGSA